MEQLHSADWTQASWIGLCAYLLGCFTTGYYLVRRRTGQDIRELGSGNVGAKNVGRVLGWTGFWVTLAGDSAKGALAVWSARRFTNDDNLAALAMLAGTLPVSAGQIRYQGRDITHLPAYRRARIGLVRTFQLASEFKRLTVMENLLAAVPGGHRPGGRTGYPAEHHRGASSVPPEGLSGGEAPLHRTGNRGDSMRGALAGRRYWRGDESAAVERATALLMRFGLDGHANSYAGDLSGGQRRIVEIMRALMAEPRVLLLDEPMAGVHPNLAGRIGNELAALAADGLTVLMVEHELAIMDEFCDPVVAMAEGAVLAEGSMAELRSRPEVVEAYLVG